MVGSHPMKIAITGATGFIGGYLVRGLSRAGHELRVLVRPGREGALEHPPERPLEPFTGDLTRPESLKGFLSGANLLVHLAAAHDHKGDQEMQKVNVAGTQALLEEARASAGPNFQIWVVMATLMLNPPKT